MKKEWVKNRRKMFYGETPLEGEGHVKTCEILCV